VIDFEGVASMSYGLRDPSIGFLARNAGLRSAVYHLIYGDSHDRKEVSTSDKRGATTRIRRSALGDDEIDQV
jgi:hypothetical protein